MIMQDGVVLLHGIFRTGLSMKVLERYFKKHGYSVLNITYPSRKHSLQELTEVIHPNVSMFSSQLAGKLHFVGHSMGGLLTRVYLKKYPVKNLGCVVMLGTPNNGSEVADFLKDWRLYKSLYGPAGQQLVTDQPDIQSILGAPDYPVGVIAGSRTVDPVSSYIIGKPNDGKVSVDSTKLEGMKAHRLIPVSHSFMPYKRQVRELALQFIKTGSM